MSVYARTPLTALGASVSCAVTVVVPAVAVSEAIGLEKSQPADAPLVPGLYQAELATWTPSGNRET